MTNINLLPWREKARNYQKRLFLMLCGAVVLGVLVLNGLWYQVLQHSIDHQLQRNALLQQEVEAAQKITKDKKAFVAEKTTTLAQMTTLQELNNQRYRIVELLSVLPKLLANGVVIDAIQIQNNVIELQGKTQTDIQVSEMVKRLKQQPGWHDIQLQEMSTASNNTTAFRLTLGMQ